jgi:hypothetical protein
VFLLYCIGKMIMILQENILFAVGHTHDKELITISWLSII